MNAKQQQKVAVFTGLCLALSSGCSHMAGKTAPDFALEDLAGNKVSLSQFRGQPVLLTFWGVG